MTDIDASAASNLSVHSYSEPSEHAWPAEVSPGSVQELYPLQPSEYHLSRPGKFSYHGCHYRSDSAYGLNPIDTLNEWLGSQTYSPAAATKVVAFRSARYMPGDIRARRSDESEKEWGEHTHSEIHFTGSTIAMTVRLKDEYRHLIDELVPVYDGISGVIRRALQLLIEDHRRRQSLDSFLEEWEEEAGPIDEDGVSEMARRYGL